MISQYNRVFADATYEEQFSRDGYTSMPLLQRAEIDELTRLYLDTVPSLPADFHTTSFLPDCPERRAMAARVQAMLEHRFANILPEYTIRSRGFIAKRGGPDQKPLRLHQDFTNVDISLHRAVHVWIPLIDVNESNGCLTVVPRSHSLTQHTSAMLQAPSPYDEYRKFLETECSLPVPTRAGSAIFFDQRLLHGSTRNTNPNIRIAIACALLPREVEQLLYVVDDEDSSKLNVLEIRDEFALQLGRGVKTVPPYPDGGFAAKYSQIVLLASSVRA